jgi:hypothetical protein
MEVRLEEITKLKVGTVIQHKNTHRVAKITDTYHPPDNPYVVSLTYKYEDSDRVNETTLEEERFTEKWDILDTLDIKSTKNKKIPV